MPISGVGGGARYVPPDPSKVEGGSKDFKLPGSIPDTAKADVKEMLTLVSKGDSASLKAAGEILKQLMFFSKGISPEDKQKISLLMKNQRNIVDLQKQIDQESDPKRIDALKEEQQSIQTKQNQLLADLEIK